MTVSEAVIKWLKSFNPTEYWKMNHIDTDKMHGDVEYALVKEPVRLPSITNNDCMDNSGFGEALEEWVSEQNREKNYPDLIGAKVIQVGVTSPFVAGTRGTNNIVYQMTVSIKYEEEK